MNEEDEGTYGYDREQEEDKDLAIQSGQKVEVNADGEKIVYDEDGKEIPIDFSTN